jgi:hypothetical protein
LSLQYQQYVIFHVWLFAADLSWEERERESENEKHY